MQRADRLPALRFSTADLPSRAQFEAWREAVGVTHEMTGVGELGRRGLIASSDVWSLGRAVVSQRRFPPLTFDRSIQRARADGLDHYSVLLMREGEWEGDADGRSLRLVPGQAALFDLARPVANRVGDNESLRLMVPRGLLDQMLPPAADLHGQVLDGPAGQLLIDFLGLLSRSLPTMTVAQAPLIGSAARDMLAACLASFVGRDARELAAQAAAPIEATRRAQVLAFIDAHLAEPDLGPERICRAVGLSRSVLYRLFETRGGVAAQIQARRLSRVRDLLSEPQTKGRIADIAFAHGFADEAHFSRAFRRAYGMAPRDVRGSHRSVPGAALPEFGLYRDWVRQA